MAYTPPELAVDRRRLVVANASAIGHAADMHPTRPADWRRAQALVEHGEVRRDKAGSLLAIATFRDAAGVDRVWVPALKPVDGVWRVRTLYPSSPRRAAASARQAELVRAGAGVIDGAGF